MAVFPRNGGTEWRIWPPTTNVDGGPHTSPFLREYRGGYSPYHVYYSMVVTRSYIASPIHYGELASSSSLESVLRPPRRRRMTASIAPPPSRRENEMPTCSNRSSRLPVYRRVMEYSTPRGVDAYRTSVD